MTRKFIVEIEDKEYAFALDRKEIVRGEQLGMRLRDFELSPVTQTSILWQVGLHKFQPKLNAVVASDLMDKYIEEGGDVQEIVGFLLEEYASFFENTQTDTQKVKKGRVELA